jgi:hypothetical protein
MAAGPGFLFVLREDWLPPTRKNDGWGTQKRPKRHFTNNFKKNFKFKLKRGDYGGRGYEKGMRGNRRGVRIIETKEKLLSL